MIENYIQFLDNMKKKYGNRNAFEYLYDGSIVDITFNEFYSDVCNVANLIIDMQLYGEKIGIISENSYAWFVYYYAIVVTGNVAVLYSKDLDEKELNSLIKRTNTVKLFASVDVMEAIQLKVDVDILWMERDFLPIDKDARLKDISIDKESMACILFTSGTTGRMKAVCLSHKNCLSSVNSRISDIISQDNRKLLYTLPFSHVGGITLATLMDSGITICILSDPKHFFKTMRTLNPTVLAAVPTYLDAIYRKWNKTKQKEMIVGKNLSLIACGGVYLSPQKIQLFRSMGINIANAYGMTETAGVGTNNLVSEETIHSIGRPAIGVEFKIEDNEILMRGDQIMMKYYDDEEETKKALKDGWMHSGDLGYIDEDGYVYITGRKKNLIILSNGENISPEEIEARMVLCQEISEVLVYAEGDSVGIKVVLYQDNDVSRENVSSFLKEYNQSVPMYKRIAKLVVVQDIPKTFTGKIIR